MYRCPRCQFDHPQAIRFCHICGYKIADEAQAASSKPSDTPLPQQKGATEAVLPPHLQTLLPSTKRIPDSHTAQERAPHPATAIPSSPVPMQVPLANQTQPVQESQTSQESVQTPEVVSPPKKQSLPSKPRSEPSATNQQHKQQSLSGISTPEQTADAQPAPVPTGTTTSNTTAPTAKDSPRSPLPPPIAMVPPPATPVLSSQNQKDLLEEQQSKRFSLTQRYIADQQTVAHPTLQSKMKSAVSPTPIPLPGKQATEDKQSSPALQEQAMKEQVIRASTPAPLPATPAPSPVPSQQTAARQPEEAKPVPNTPLNTESLTATSKAAEHWRTSWRNRQRAEAGPATNASRGQASVPEPLLAMQHSLARMRAIILPKPVEQTLEKKLAYWGPLLLMICLVLGMGAYIVSTYLPASTSISQAAASGSVLPPVISFQSNKTTIPAGSTFAVHGERFLANHTITFLVDTNALKDTSGNAASVKSSDKGTFEANLSLPDTWLAGSYTLEALDASSGQQAFVDLQVLPKTLPPVESDTLALLMNDDFVTSLNFTAVVGSTTQKSQQITLKNRLHTPISWTVTAIADNHLNWLIIDQAKNSGTLGDKGKDTLAISVLPTGLKSLTQPYTGHLIFTLNTQEQVILPVSLKVQETAIEVVINPTPIIAVQKPDGTCQPTTLTLINLSHVVVTWAANPYTSDQQHIHVDDQTTAQGTLQPSGEGQDTHVLHLSCISTQLGEKLYHITVSYNLNTGGAAQDVPISIRQSY